MALPPPPFCLIILPDIRFAELRIAGTSRGTLGDRHAVRQQVADASGLPALGLPDGPGSSGPRPR